MDQIVLIETIQIVSSPLNPRKVVDQNSIIELAESIKSIGLLQPVTIRPKTIDETMPENNVYELVLGSRRLAATRLNGEEHILAIVKEMNDDEVLEAMIIENLQRKDIEPLDEAKAFNELLEKGISYVDIAAKVGKSPEFVKLRIKLNYLIPEFQTMLTENKLSLSAAFELCKVINEIQEAIYTQHYADGVEEIQDWNKLTIVELKEKLSKQFIPLANAEFNTADCTLCPYNTTGLHSLFSEYNGNNCTNISCFQTKKQEHIIATIKENVANDIPIMCKASAEKTIAQLKELGVEEPVLYLSSKYDLSLYPETDDDDEINNYDAQSVSFGYTRAFTVGMIKDKNKYLYFKLKDKVEETTVTEEKVQQNVPAAVVEAKKEEQSEIEKLLKKDARNIELKDEKIIADTKKLLIDSDYRDKENPLFEFENHILMGCILFLCTNTKIKEITAKFDKSLGYLENVANITPGDRNIIRRCYIKQLLVSATSDSNKDIQEMLRAVSLNLYTEKYNTIEAQYEEKYLEQKKRINARISVINGEAEPAKKRETKADKTKPDTYKPKTTSQRIEESKSSDDSGKTTTYSPDGESVK